MYTYLSRQLTDKRRRRTGICLAIDFNQNGGENNKDLLVKSLGVFCLVRGLDLRKILVMMGDE